MHTVRSSRIWPARPEGGRRFPVGAAVVARRRYWSALGMLLAAVLIVGCARQYHWYDCGCDCVNYRYCRPGPLPYTPYCSCPTPIAESYDLQASQPRNAESTQDDESRRPD